MMRFAEYRKKFEAELQDLFSQYPADVSEIEESLRRKLNSGCFASAFDKKAAIYQVLAEECRVNVFRYCPFYFELITGRRRNDLGRGPLGGFLKTLTFGRELAEDGANWWRPLEQTGLSTGWHVLDDNHHTIGYEIIFKFGFNGLIKLAEEKLTEVDSAKKKSFLRAMIAGLKAVKRIAERFAEKAQTMYEQESDPMIRGQLATIADTAKRVPADPPGTFYEALNTIVFVQEVVQSIEGNGISVLGHFDRLLQPFYEHDVENGVITDDEADDYLRFFLTIPNIRLDFRHNGNHVGSNTTVTIGGCNEKGEIVFNDITRKVIRIYKELHLIDPKLNVRISSQHPQEFFALLGELMQSKVNSFCVFNDDVIIRANEKMGKTVEDSRSYVGGGCQENVLANTEVNSRATIYLNLLQVFLMGFNPGKWRFFSLRDHFSLEEYTDRIDFEDFYRVFRKNLERIIIAHIKRRNYSEALGETYNPCPLHSSMIEDCLDNAEDMMSGGARYNYGSVSLTGVGTLVDSLFAVKHVVYDRKLKSLEELRAVLAGNFENYESFHKYLLHRIPKFGQNDPEVNCFAGRLFADLARISRGHRNSRNGVSEASLFSFRTFAGFGRRTGATPDGRKTGQDLSAGMTPSYLALGRECQMGDIFNTMKEIDLTNYPVVAVLDVRLPAAVGSDISQVVIRQFLEAGGSVFQPNCLDAGELRKAHRDPDAYPDLIVRISGYSAYFNTLDESTRKEVLARSSVLLC